MTKWIVMATCFAAVFVVGCNAEEDAPADTPTTTEGKQSAAPNTETETTQAALLACETCSMDHKKEDMKEIGSKMYCTDCGCADKAMAATADGKKTEEKKPEEAKSNE